MKYQNTTMEKKFVKLLFISCADREPLLDKMDTYHNNLKESSTTKRTQHLASSYLLFKHCTVDATKNILNCYRGKKGVESFCKDLKEHATKIINYEKKGNYTINL